MDNSLQSALQNLIKTQATPEEIELLQQALSRGQIFIGGNVQNSIIIAGDGNIVQLSAEALNLLTTVNNRSAIHQLPQPPADFVGRKNELKIILDNGVERKGAFISGITGMAGIGKTALGLYAANELVTQYSDAQFYVDLRGTSKKTLKPFDVMKYIVQSFYPTTDLKNLSESELGGEYRSVLTNKKALLFFDNARNANQIMPLLPPVSCCVFVTSRWQFVVPGLQPLKLDILGETESIQLLLELCSRISIDDAKQIAFLCGYLPLALRLAGSFLQVNIDWTPIEYIVQLSKKNRRLSTLQIGENGPDIKSIFSLSYNQLSKQEKRYWNMLAVFPASFKRNALKTVWEMNDENTHKLASKLCVSCLLDYDLRTDRYHAHDLLLEFANAKLTKNEREKSLLNYFLHYQDVWRATENMYTKRGDELTSGLLLFDSEFNHIDFAYKWAIENYEHNDKILAVLKEIPDFVFIMRIRLHPNKQIEWCKAGYEAAQKMEDGYNQNKLLGNIGNAYSNLGEWNTALDYYEKAMYRAQEINDRMREGFWVGNMGVALVNLGDWHQGIERYDQALYIAKEIGDKQREYIWLGNLGTVYDNLGKLRKSLSYFEQALESSREYNNRQHEANWLGNIGITYMNLGELQRGIDYLEQSLRITIEIGDRQGESFCLGNLGAIYTALGLFDKDMPCLLNALEIARESGNRQLEGKWLRDIGVAKGKIEKWNEGIEHLNKALSISVEIRDRQMESTCWGNIGIIYSNLREWQKATTCFDQSLKISQEMGDLQHECEFRLSLAEMQINFGETVVASQNIEKVLETASDLDFKLIEAKALILLAKLFKEERNRLFALKYARQSRVIFEAIVFPELEKVDQFIESINQTP